MHITASNETIIVLVKFRVSGNLRFLSHAETVKLFQRACVRAGIKIQYSQGFNPRPKLSLPLPRTVGVESDDDLLCLRTAREMDNGSRIKAGLSSQLPQGCELLEVSTTETKTSFQPCLATYVLAVRQEELDEELRTRIKHLLASERLDLQRRRYAKNSKLKTVDVRGFLKSIELNGGDITVECRISLAGSIRPDEILDLLELNVEKLAAPIRRTNVKWQE